MTAPTKGMDDSTYYRAIIVDRGEQSAVRNADKVFGLRPKGRSDVGGGALCVVRIESATKPPAYLERRLPQREKGKETVYSYDLCVSDLDIPNIPGLLLAGPTRKVLSELRPSGTYVGFNLPLVCDDQFSSRSDPRVTVARLHVRLYGERGDAATSATIYGRDVLKSTSMREFLRGRKIDVRTPPFQRLAMREKAARSFDVSSCRLVLDDGHQRFALNVDQFGNFSFRFTGPQSVEAINALLLYVHQTKALGRTDLDPRKRSDAAIRAIQGEATDNE